MAFPMIRSNDYRAKGIPSDPDTRKGSPEKAGGHKAEDAPTKRGVKSRDVSKSVTTAVIGLPKYRAYEPIPGAGAPA